MVNVAKNLIVLRSKERIRHRRFKDLERYLEVSETLEDDFISTEDARVPARNL